MTRRLSDYIQIISGGTPSTKNKEYWNGDVGWISVEDFAGDQKYIYRTEKTITELGLKESSTKLLKTGDIIISARGTVGELGVLTKEMAFNQSCFGLRVLPNLMNQEYLYYWLKWYIPKLQHKTQGSVFKTINLSTFNMIEIDLPDLKIQEQIGLSLSTIDKCIQTGHEIVNTLETLSKLIYNYWFLDFNFPDENGKPYKASGGKMVWDEELKQEIPEGWEISNLGNLIISTVKGEWGKEYSSGKENLLVNCVRGTDYSFLDGSSLNNNIPRRYVKNDESFLKPGDLIVEISGGSSTQSTGRVAYINQALLDRFESPLNTSNFCKGLRIKSGFQNWFYQTWSLLYKNNVFFNYESKTTGIKNLMLDSLLTTLKFPIPDTNTLENYNALIDPIYNKIQVELKEIDQLQEIRSFLLPLLMNGQVTFKDIED